MLKLLYILLLNVLLAEMSYGRHITPPDYSFQTPYFTPYKDIDYSYTGPEFYRSLHHQPYSHPHPSSLYTPPGTYYDQRRGILRPFPGGGIPVLVDHVSKTRRNCNKSFLINSFFIKYRKNVAQINLWA